MAEYIKRETVINHLDACMDTIWKPEIVALKCFVEGIPAADVAPVVHSYWEHKITVDEENIGVCHNCKYPVSLLAGSGNNRIIVPVAEQRWTDREWRVKKMIDIDQTIKAGTESICPSCNHYLVCRATGNQPCAECNQYAPVAQHGKWVSLVVKRENWKGVLHDFYQPYSCSICQNPNTFMGESAFCPHCGAKMDGAE